MADDLGGLLDLSHPPIEVDKHLSWQPTPIGEALAVSLAELRAVNEGIGVLIDQGLPPEAARRELHRRAHAAEVTIGDASRSLLASVHPEPSPAEMTKPDATPTG